MKSFLIFMRVHGLCIQCLVFMFIWSSMNVLAYDKGSKDDIKHAVRVLKNIDKDFSKEWAISLLQKAAEIDTCAYAMNTLGLAYMAGVGVKQDSIQAIYWFEKAGEHGYSEAYHNLGMMYKNGCYGVKQDFVKAYNAFVNGVEAGSVICKYDAGFMLYKGLGICQNYNEAVNLFNDAANESEHTPSLYMLGLCYRNGYGVLQDTAKASYYLNRAAMLSFGPAMEELQRTQPENYLDEISVSNYISTGLPTQMPNISIEVNDTSFIFGQYRGFLVMYDWSGKYVLAEKPLKINIYRDEKGTASGTLIMANDTIEFKADITNAGHLVFSKGNVCFNERYNIGKKITYRMDNAILDIWKDKIRGRLNLYSLKLKEPERPMYIELSRVSDIDISFNKEDERFTRIIAMPNPFSNEFCASFELQEQCDAQIRIFDQAGKMVFIENIGIIDSGKHNVMIAPQIKDGTYVLNIKAGKQILRTIIVKKGGVL